MLAKYCIASISGVFCARVQDCNKRRKLLPVEFVVKTALSLVATIFVVRWSWQQSQAANSMTASAMHRLRTPIFLAAAFFVCSLLLSRTGMLGIILEFDPSLPFWFVLLSCKLLFLAFIVKRVFRHANPELKGVRNLLIAAIFIGATAVETVVILPAALFVGPSTIDKNGVTLQTLQVTCIPSALSTICRLYGDPINEYEATRRVKTLLPGSLVSHSITGCHALGFAEAAYTKLSLEEVLLENLPFIITVSAGVTNIEHAIGVIGWREGKIYLADPLRGLVITNRDQLEKIREDVIRLGPRKGTGQQAFLNQFTPELLANL
ncbi:MAG: hypothetical protein KKB51_24495 [Candidatus Riflebacteria bacterium]|nr:hypothetical protein [Candidatus Riflebacteria bacterium]